MSISSILNPDISPTVPSRIESNYIVISISDDEYVVGNASKNNKFANNNHIASLIASIYSCIPDSISCAGIMFDKREFKTVLMPKSWVFDNVISAFSMLLSRDIVFILDTLFVPMSQEAIRNKYTATHAEFLEFFGQNPS